MIMMIICTILMIRNYLVSDYNIIKLDIFEIYFKNTIKYFSSLMNMNDFLDINDI